MLHHVARNVNILSPADEHYPRHPSGTTGTYKHTTEEIEEGARLAWRNSARCVGRATWKSLQLFDRRDVVDPDAIFDCLVEHIRAAWVGGHLQPTITVFQQSPSFGKGFKIWNGQFFMYVAHSMLRHPSLIHTRISTRLK